MNKEEPSTLNFLLFQLALILLLTCLSMARGAPCMVQEEVDHALVKEHNREGLSKEKETFGAFEGDDSEKTEETDNEAVKGRVKRTIEPIIGQLAGSAVQIGVTFALQVKEALIFALTGP